MVASYSFCELNNRKNSPLQKLLGGWVQAFGATSSGSRSGIIWVDKHYLQLVNVCLEYHPQTISNACPPKQSQKSLH